MIMQESSVHPGMGSSWMDDVQNDAFTMRRLGQFYRRAPAHYNRIIVLIVKVRGSLYVIPLWQ